MAVPRETWATGDYVVGRYLERKRSHADKLELCDGTLHALKHNDIVVGSLGERCATQEVVGSWKMIGKDQCPTMDHICGSGMFGIETSRSKWHDVETAKFQYIGHCFRRTKICMRDFAPTTATKTPDCPMVLIVGSSMSCGKTISSKVIIDVVKNKLGFKKVAGTKFTGGGYKHDTSQMLDAGAQNVVDFIDAGYCSTVMPPDEFRECALPVMLGLLSDLDPDCIVAELGASPLEPYNGIEVIRELLAPETRPSRLFIVLCATDAYAAYGLCHALRKEGLDFEPDMVCGMAANNSAGIDLVEQLTGLLALNVESGSDSVDELCMLLKKRLLE